MAGKVKGSKRNEPEITKFIMTSTTNPNTKKKSPIHKKNSKLLEAQKLLYLFTNLPV